MANPSLQIGNSKWAIKEDNLLGYSTAGTRFLPIPITMTRASAGTRVNPQGLVETVELLGSELIPSIATISNGSSTGTSEIVQISGNSYSTESDGTNTSTIRPKFDLATTSGKGYKLTITPTGSITGTIACKFYDGSSYLFTDYDFSTVKEIYFTDNGSVNLSFNGQNTFSVSGFTLSVKESTKNDLARVDYTGSTSSLLAEPQRTNLVTDSVDIDTYFTNQVDAIVTNDYGTSPTGENNSTRVQWADSTSFIYRAESVSTDTSASIFVKGISGETVMFGFGGNVTTGTVYTFDGSWQRIIFTGSTGTTIFLSSYFGATATDFEVFGLQLEVGSYATSYIPTSGSTVTRVKDQYTKTGISDKINSEEGVLFVEMAALSNDTSFRAMSISDGTTSNRITLVYNGGIRAFNVVAGSVSSAINYSTTITTAQKIAIVWSSTSFALWVNGSEISSQSGISIPSSTLNKLSLDQGNGNNNMFAKVNQLKLYKEALSNSELIALTTI